MSEALGRQSKQVRRRRWAAVARKSFSPAGVWRQVHHDSFGTKDVQDAPTLSYTWTADQFGHFHLGLVAAFVFGMLFYSAVSLWDEIAKDVAGPHAAAWCVSLAGLGFAVWFADKERKDFNVAVRNAAKGRSPFLFNRREVLLNCGVASFFTIAGVLLTVAGFWAGWWALLLFAAEIAVAIPVGLWWLRRKIAFQQADLPYLYRLANFPDNFVDRAEAELIRKLADPRETPTCRHIIIDGPLSAGKTSLAVGVGTEFAFNLGVARFISLVKLNQYGLRRRVKQRSREGIHGGTVFRDGRTLWPLPDVDLLVVDDLDIGLAHQNPIDPAVVEEALVNGPGRAFFAAFRERRTFWIAGTSDHIPQWRKVVADLVADGEEEAIRVVKLKDPLHERFTIDTMGRKPAGTPGAENAGSRVIPLPRARRRRGGAAA